MNDNPDCLDFHVNYNYQGPVNHFLRHVKQPGTKFVQVERESETRFSYQSERSTFGRGPLGLQSKALAKRSRKSSQVWKCQLTHTDLPAMGGQTDLQVNSSWRKSQKSHFSAALPALCLVKTMLRPTCANLPWCGQTVKNLRQLALKFELDQSDHKLS